MKRWLVAGVLTATVLGGLGSAASASTVSGVLTALTVGAIEAEIVTLVNLDRRAAGLGSLSVNSWAAETSRNHSEKMAAAGDIWHNREIYFAQGRSVMGATLLGENVVQTLSATDAQSAFMDSDLHRQNILDSRFTHIGVGVALNGDGILFVTQAFARIPGAASAADSGEPSEVTEPTQAAASTRQSRPGHASQIESIPSSQAQQASEPAIHPPVETHTVAASNRPVVQDSYSVADGPSSVTQPRRIKTGWFASVVTAALATAAVLIRKRSLRAGPDQAG